MSDDLVVNSAVAIPRSELSVRFSRSSGPGGQSVNTTDSRVQLSFDLAHSPNVPDAMRERAMRRLAGRLVDGCVVVTASEQRSQWKNRRTAEERLVILLAEAFAPGPRRRRPTRPTNASVEQRIRAKKSRSVVKRLRRSAGRDAE